LKILLTGTAGFIGMHTALSLLRRGDTVVGIDNLNDYYDVQLKRARLACLAGDGNFRFIAMDIADRAAMAALFARERLTSHPSRRPGGSALLAGQPRGLR